MMVEVVVVVLCRGRGWAQHSLLLTEVTELMLR